MPTYLDGIVAAHRQTAANDLRSFQELLEQARDASPGPSFLEALQNPGLSVIAEFKRKSPSKGPLNETMVLHEVLDQYQKGGASAISVLTDQEFFGGSLEDLVEARRATTIPLLRKDFVVDARDLCDARLMGADAVLLIVAALSNEELHTFIDISRMLSLDVLVEVHDQKELSRARVFEPEIIGINQRNLHTFDVDTHLALELLEAMPHPALAVAESGISSIHDAQSVADAGFDAVLIGEMFVRSSHPEDLVKSVVGLQVGVRQGSLRP